MTKTETIRNSLQHSMSYTTYRTLLEQLFEEGKVTGPAFSRELLHYSGLNLQRMKKWEKHFQVNLQSIPSVKAIKDETWLVISEGWCGDAAHILPVINALAKENLSIKLRIVLRDENPDLIDHFLTNGSRSIPILIRLNPEQQVLGIWGPRPEAAQMMINGLKTSGMNHDEYIQKLQIWYSRDRGQEIERELVSFISDSVSKLEVERIHLK